MTEDTVRRILLSGSSHKQLSRELGISREAVRRIRAGTLHADKCPEIERFEYRNALCTDCVFYHNKHKCCDLGIPESESEANLFGYNNAEVGLCFARRCATFIQA